jgi:hypothetical protein
MKSPQIQTSQTALVIVATMLASFGRSQTIDRAGAETLVREACSTMEIGSDCSEFQASLMDTPDVKWDVVGRRGDEWPVHGAVTPTGKLYAVWSEWTIETHRARRRTGRNAWRDEADVREFLLPFVRKYATAEEWDETGRVAFEPSVPGEKGKRGRVFVRFLRTTGGSTAPWPPPFGWTTSLGPCSRRASLTTSRSPRRSATGCSSRRPRRCAALRKAALPH